MANNHLHLYLQELNPPVPPQAVGLVQTLALDPVPLAVRRQRVANGSRRKRDLAAVEMAEELERLGGLCEAGQQATKALDAVKARLRPCVPDSTYRLWLEPLEVAGSKGDVLMVSAPQGIRAWAERRYSSLLREALEGTRFESINFVDRESLEAA